MWSVRSTCDDNQNESTLTHYGVKGMKWGVRKEYEAKGRKVNKNRKDKVIDFESDKFKTKLIIQGTDTYDNYKEQLKDYSKRITERSNFYMPKAIASKRFQNLPKIENRLSDDLEKSKVNDATASKKRTTNCFQCTIAYEMRQRGYDVQANTNYGGKNFEYLHAFDIQDSFRVKTKSNTSFGSSEYATTAETAAECYNRVATQCLEYGDGARGAITMHFPLGGGHVMNWIVEDGEFKLVDAQNTEYDEYETFSNTTFDVEVFRLDNAELLPGSTDFVEAYKPPINIKEIANNIGKNVSSLISKGKESVKKFLNIQTKTTVGHKPSLISKGKESVKKFLNIRSK